VGSQALYSVLFYITIVILFYYNYLNRDITLYLCTKSNKEVPSPAVVNNQVLFDIADRINMKYHETQLILEAFKISPFFWSNGFLNKHKIPFLKKRKFLFF